MPELIVYVLVALVLAVASIRFGILIGNRLGRAADRDDEEPRGPAS